MRWRQRYSPHIEIMTWLMAGLHSGQPRAIQHATISRAVFQIYIAPRQPGAQLDNPHDLVLVRLKKVDITHSSVNDSRARLLQLLQHARGPRPSHDYLFASSMIIIDSGSNPINTTVGEFVFLLNSIPRVADLNAPSGAGYPKEMTMELVKSVFNAFVDDNASRPSRD